MFLYILAAGLMADGHNQPNAASNEAIYAVGYFLCSIAVLMTIACVVMTIKLKKINDHNLKNKKNLNL